MMPEKLLEIEKNFRQESYFQKNQHAKTVKIKYQTPENYTKNYKIRGLTNELMKD